MLKHIIGQSLYQIIVLMLLLFFAPTFIPEYRDQYDKLLDKNDL